MVQENTVNASLSNPQALPRLSNKDVFLMIAKSAAKRGIDLLFAAKGAALRAAGVVDFPLPPNSRLRRTSSHTIRHYYESGLTTMMPILTAARMYGVDLEATPTILDFGCGVARQLLQLTRQYPNARAYACDAAESNIHHIQRAFPQVQAYTNDFDPPLKYADGTFDLVYSVSTFSHFSPDDAQLWLGELKRVTKPGGLLCLTINGITSLEYVHRKGLHLDYTADRLLAEGGWYDVNEVAWLKSKAADRITTFGSGTSCEPRPTGNMYYTPEYLRSFMERAGLEVVAHAPGIIDRMQDLAVMRKPA